MRRLTLLLIGFVALLTASCTHNNGDIGFWFGTWQCEEITIDGVKKTDYTRNMFFKFQTNVCDIVVTYPHNEYRQRFAEFKEHNDGTITLDFSYTADGDFAYDFNPPAESMLKKGLNVLHYDKINGKKLILTFENDDQTITYTLKKQ
ncbi:MAG: lipocalin-like domain-containing protein [Muribaculaceae bacterium]|nr:lipocalin-like domain-containing protein [Muribaculaceae bacterium]